MRIAVLSDIHGNLHALDAVLSDVEREDVHEIWCLGDVVGYGADPNDCCARIREQADAVLCGNHDMAVTGELSLEEFSRGAAIAAPRENSSSESSPVTAMSWLPDRTTSTCRRTRAQQSLGSAP